MKQINLSSATQSERTRPLPCAWIGLAILLSVVPLCFGQKDFDMDEKLKVEQFKRANPLFLGGQKDFVKEKWQKAREKLENCIEFMPEHANAWLLLAQIESMENNLPKALEDVQKAKTNFVHIAQFQTLIEERLFDKLRVQRSQLEEQLSALEDEMASSRSRSGSGNVGNTGNTGMGQPSTGEGKINQIKSQINAIDMQIKRPIGTTIDIPAEYFFVHGNIFFKLRQYNEARDQYLEVIKRDPTHANAYNNLANLYFMSKKYQRALDYLSQGESNGATVNPKLKEAVLKALGK